jgi:hypothetical protein
MAKQCALHGLGSACVAACAVLAGCAQTPPQIAELPELPIELARDLAPARTAPVLMTRPAPAATPAPLPPRPQTPPLLAPARACTAVFEGYVTYPITVCYPPTLVFERLELAAARDAPQPPGATGVLPARYFKLSALSRFGLPWFCSVRSGPWFAHIEGAQICNVDPNVRAFNAVILGAPEPVAVIWSGALTDVPPPLALVSMPQVSEFCTCCSGFMCPDGSCKPNFDMCGVGPPAAK